MAHTPNRTTTAWAQGPPSSSLSAMKSQVEQKSGIPPSVSSSSTASSGTVGRQEFEELKAMIQSLVVSQSKSSQQVPVLPAPKLAVTIGKGTGNSSKSPGILAQLSASIGDGSVPRSKTSPSTPHPPRDPANLGEDDDLPEDPLLADVSIDGKIDEPSAKAIEAAGHSLIGPVQVKNVLVNHMGKYMIWFRNITWKDGRNRREATNICRALDAFLDEQIDPNTSIGFEILARRLAGLIVMNEGKVKNPSSVADQLEYREEDSMVPHSVLTAAVKTSAIYASVTNSGDKPNKWNNNNKGKGKDGKGTGGNYSKTASGTTSTKS